MNDSKLPKLEKKEAQALRNYLGLACTDLGKLVDAFMKEASISTEVAAWKALQAIKTPNKKTRRGVSGATLHALRRALGVSEAKFETVVLDHSNFFHDRYGAIVEGPSTNASSAENNATNAQGQDGAHQSNLDAPGVRRLSPTEMAKFVEFFGPAISDPEKRIQLVFPRRKLKKAAEEARQSPFEFDPKCRVRPGAKAEDVSGYLAFEDVKAAILLSNLLTMTAQRAVRVRQENKQPFDGSSCVIVFGLGFTSATRTLERHFNPRLFSIYYGKSPKKKMGSAIIDLFNFRCDSRADLREISIKDEKDVALIVRVVPKKNAQPWFICAGRTAIGTSAAGFYLAQKWSVLYDLYKAKGPNALAETSLAVVIEHDSLGDCVDDVDPYSPFSVEASGNMLHWDSKKLVPCIAWGDYSEMPS